MFHAKRRRVSKALFHVKHILHAEAKLVIDAGSTLLPDTELTEDHIENVLDIDPAQ